LDVQQWGLAVGVVSVLVGVISVLLAAGALYYARKSSRIGQRSVEVAERSAEISERALATSEEQLEIARDETERSITIEQDPVLLSVASVAEGLLFFISNTGAKPVKIEDVWIRFNEGDVERSGNPVTFVNMEIDQGPSVPGWLNPGESIHFYADLRHVERELRSLGHESRGTAYLSVVDGLGHEHKQEIVVPIEDCPGEKSSSG
jgi:hypothetical protein